jgi:heat shock protein HslJ
MRRVLLATAVAVAVAVVGCGHIEPDEVHGTWQAVRAQVAGEPVDLTGAGAVTLTIANGRATGRASCNQYDVPIEFGRTTLAFGSGEMTAMACTGPTSDVERIYLDSIRPTVSYLVDDTTLTLTSPAGVWVFERTESAADASTPVSP